MTTCSDCGTQYTDDAPYCPNCGKPNPARQGGAPATPAGSAPGDAGSASGTPAGGFGGGANPGGGFGGGASGATPGGGFGPGAGGGAAGGGYGGAPETPAGGAPYGGYAGGAPGGGYAGGPQGGYGGGQQGGGGYGAGGYGGGQPAGGAPQNIPNYLVQAILVTLCCCLPLGIVSIIYATQVNTKRDAGDINGALEASKNAKKWAIIGVVAGVIWIGVIMAFNGLAFIMALANGNHS
jgi:hypothetical protein